MQIAGKEFGLKYNVYATEKLIETKGRGKSTTGTIMALIWIGYLGWCFVRQIDPELTFEEVSDFVDTVDENKAAAELVTDALKKFNESDVYKKLIKKAPEVDEKKSVSGEGNTIGTIYTSLPGEKLD